MSASATPASVNLSVDRDGWTKGIQLSINTVYSDGGSIGYRIHGPKFNGSGETILCHTLTARDLDELTSAIATARAAIAKATGGEA